MINGIFIKRHVKLPETNELWNKGVRFVYAEARNNDCLNQVRQRCEYVGWPFGVWVRPTYPPEPGTSASQAEWLYNDVFDVLKSPMAKLPVVLDLGKNATALPETSYYRQLIRDIIGKFNSYIKKEFVLKAPRSVITWLTPDETMLKMPLWVYEPTAEIYIKPWTAYAVRSYAPRDIAGITAEWVDYPGTDLTKMYTTRVPVNSTEPIIPEPPPPAELTDSQKIDFIYDFVKKICQS